MKKFKISTIISCILLIIVVYISSVLLTPASNTGVIINEIRTDYGSVLYDFNYEYHGFVEIYNSSDTPINLDGWSVSDSKNNLKKYTIAECTIQPNDYIVFWTNEADDIKHIDNGCEYFLGFSIDSTESIFLSDSNGVVVSKAKASSAQDGLSFSLINKQWCLTTASPGKGNCSKAIHTIDIPAPVFSHSSGFYEGNITLSISGQKDHNIYYTLDGSEPTEHSILYTTPINITDKSNSANILSSYTNISNEEVIRPKNPVAKSTVIRAIAIDNHGNKSNETYGSYFLDFNNKYGYDNIHILSIITEPENLFDENMGIYVLGNVWNEIGIHSTKDAWTAPANFRMEGKGWRRKAYIELFNPNKQLNAKQTIGISIHGGFSTIKPQKGFNLYALPDIDGNDTVGNNIFTGSQRSVMLRTSGTRDYYSTKFRDALNQKLVENRAIGIQRAIPCQVFINGEYWGLYNYQERLDETYIEAHYNVNSDNVILVKNTTVVAGQQEDYELYSKVVDYAIENDLSENNHYNYICNQIDIQSYIDYYCFQIYVANADIIYNNYALWRTKDVDSGEYSDGKWRWLLYDTDDSAGIEPGHTDRNINSFIEGQWHRPPARDALFMALCQNEDFVTQFTESFIEIGQNNFGYENVENVIDEMTEGYKDAVVVSHQRFFNAEYSEKEYITEVDKLKLFFSQRYDYIYQYMKEFFK